QYLETSHLLPGYILSSQGDRMAMAHGVETRFPFLDHRLIECAARIAPGLKLRGLREKHILREAVAGLLPAEIEGRPKQPYRAPDSAAFRGQAAAYVDDLLSPASVGAAGLFNPVAAARLLAKSQRAPLAGFRDNAAFAGILSTQLWVREFAAGATRMRAQPAA
ncbi:MAG: asparagine synthase C-terminal domain-containing protein, partial [Alphaproteobacteria bacterium]|nr:asparagine synthase C-terminal domain-containing protein [Alphaproteobacteria bacterium]